MVHCYTTLPQNVKNDILDMGTHNYYTRGQMALMLIECIKDKKSKVKR